MHALTATVLGALLILLAGCASTAQPDAAREAWKAHDQWGAARCGGRSIDGVCLHGGQ
jgi:outer membrane biogenesis lipoprotein LolB